MPRLLIVDDEADILKALRRELHRTDWEVVSTTSADEALELVSCSGFDVVMSDFRMPSMTGADFLAAARSRQPGAVRIILSGYADRQAMLDSINEAEIFKFLTKPWNSEALLETLRLAMIRREQILERDAAEKVVRLQNDRLARTAHAIELLEADEPGITKVRFSPTDTIVLTED